jgi:outer membrane protein assembly factor BamB
MRIIHSLAMIVATAVGIGWYGPVSAGEANEFTFIHISDVHVPDYGFAIGMKLDEETMLPMMHQQKLRQLVNECLTTEPKPAFVINSGDTGDAGWTPFLKLYRKMMMPLVSAGIPVYTVVGNHDLDYAGIGKGDLAEIFDPLGPASIGRHGTRYSFDYEGCHFVVVNNRPKCGLIRLCPDDLTWLRDDLKKIRKDRRVLVFLHADMTGDDTFDLVEMLQNFKYPVIFRGHDHTEGIEKWGGVTVVVTGSLYGEAPAAGGYRIVTVRKDEIVTRTRDFATPDKAPGQEKTIELAQPGPKLRIIEPKPDAILEGSISVLAETDYDAPGGMEYLVPDSREWKPMQGGHGRWEAVVPAPASPGRHFLALRFKGDNGSVVWAHTPFTVPGEKVREIWTRNLGSSMHGEPAIRQDIVILPTLERGVYALRLDDGKEVWHRKVKQGEILGRVVADDGAVYYGAGRTMYACAANTGKPLWQTPLEGTIVTGPIFAEGRLFVPSGEHQLYCLDARRGNILWKYRVDLPILMEPAADGNRVYFGAMDGFFRALDASNGEEVWKRRLSSQEDPYTTAPFWPPALEGGTVIVGKSPAGKEKKNIIAFEASSGKTIWSRSFEGGLPRFLMDKGKGRFYAPYSDGRLGGIQCLSITDGSVLWSKATGVSMYNGCFAGSTVLVRDGYDIGCVEPVTGKLLWTYRTSLGPQGSLFGTGATATRENMAIVGTMDGQVLALKW